MRMAVPTSTNGCGGAGRFGRDERIPDRLNQLVVQGMAGITRDNVAHQRSPEQRKVSDEVKDLMANELVLKPETAVEDLSLADHDGIVEGSALSEPLFPECGDIPQEPVCPRSGYFRDEDVFSH